MDVSGLSPAMGALRVGLQVATNQRGPLLEFYFQLHNDFGPEVVTPPRALGGVGALGITLPESRHRRQHIFVTFTAINIGSLRAEKIKLSIEGNARTRYPIDQKRFGCEIAQLAPGQSLFLFKLESHDLFDSGDCKFNLSANYNGPRKGLNYAPRRLADWRNKKQYRTEFEFDAAAIAGDLPPPNYA